MSDINPITEGVSLAGPPKEVRLMRKVYKEIKLLILFVFVLHVISASFSVFYRADFANNAIFGLIITACLFILVWLLSFSDEMRYDQALNVKFEPIILMYKKSFMYFIVGISIIMGVFVAYPSSKSGGYRNQAENWYDPAPNGKASSSPSGKSDPCKIFLGLCGKDTVTFASLATQGYELKYSDLKSKQFILRKDISYFYCQGIFPAVPGYGLLPEVDIGSAICKPIRKGAPADVELYSDYSLYDQSH